MSGLGPDELKSPSESSPSLLRDHEVASLHARPIVVAPQSAHPVVSHDAAMQQMCAMFPQVEHDIILYELNQNGQSCSA
jgi:hypothetical protein